MLALVATGLSNAQIATGLFLSEKTVERHLGSIFLKLNVSSRDTAVRAAMRVGALSGVQIEGRSSPD